MAEETRTQMWCDMCRQADDHPRHVTLMADGSVRTRHMDCCRDNGCVSGHCDEILTASGEKRGYDLLAHIKENM